MEELIGQQLGTYTIERMLGRGGMAAVFLAHDSNMERQVAIKVLPREFSFDHVYVERFKREVKTIANLTHPNIVPVHAFGEQDGWTYIVMTYLQGGTLSGLIRQKGSSQSLEDIVALVDQMASGLQYAHKQGIIHRDFKPANVLLGDDLHVALSDFGIAKVTASTAQLTGTGLMGTPAYMAPELANKGGVTPLVDVYALGVTVYELLVGSAPYEADTPMGLIIAHVSSPIPDARRYRQDIPDGVQAVIEGAMAKNPKERYQSAGDVANGLREALGMGLLRASTDTVEYDDDGSTIATPPKSQTPPRSTKARPVTGGAQTNQAERPKWNIGAIAGVAALLIAIGVAILVLPTLLNPPTAELPVTQPVADSPTSVVEAVPTAVFVEPTARVLLGGADFRTSGSGDFQPLAGSQTLAVGAAIRMGADGVAVLTFSPGVSVEVQPGAVVNIDRIEVVGDTLFVELTQEAGTTYHFVGDDAGGTKRDYMVHTPHGTIKAVGTEFWVNESPEGWYYIPADGTTTFAHNDSTEPTDQYIEHASTGDCLFVDNASAVTNCANLPGLTVLTDGSSLKAIETPTAVVVVNDTGGGVPTATLQITSTACAEKYYCSGDPSQKGTLVHEKPDCTIELLPGNSQCAYQLGGGQPPPGCGNCGDGGIDYEPGGSLGCVPPSYPCMETRYDACDNICYQSDYCGTC